MAKTPLTAVLTVMLGTLVVSAEPASGAVIVDTVSDVLDGTTTSIAALIAAPGPDGFISLREAITATNNTANGTNPDEIHFSIAGFGPHTIQPGTALPSITDQVIIDGRTEPDYSTTPMIEIDGSLTSSGNGFNLGTGSDGSALLALVINRFKGHGIYILGSGTHTIAGNYIGTNVNGLSDLGNGGSGIYAVSSNNIIGGLSAAERNVIGGNDVFGIAFLGSSSGYNTIIGNYIGLNANGNGTIFNDDDAIEFSDAHHNTVGGSSAGARNVICAGTGEACVYAISSSAIGNVIQGNYLGTDASGTVRLGGGTYCVRISTAPNSVVGGDQPGEGNVMAGYLQSGISGTGIGSVVQGNFIGTDATGTLDLTNGMWGVILNSGASNWTIGGTTEGAGNIIANNSRVGIHIAPTVSTGIRINRNIIRDSSNLGIDINGDGVTDNDAGDGDNGPNRQQNFPFLAAAQTDGVSALAISGHLDSSPSTNYRLEFFANTAAHITLHGEGQRYLGHLDITTDTSGFEVFNKTFSSTAVAVGEHITATATDVAGNTSEFSRRAIATPSDQVYVNTTSDVSDGDTASLTNLSLNPGADGVISLREAIAAADANPNGSGPDEILFDIPATDIGHFYYADDSMPGQLTPANIAVTQEIDDAAIVGIDPDFARSWFTVAVTGSELPTINDPIDIDGTTQAGFVNSPIIEIDGSALGSSPDGFDLDAGGSTIRGLVITSFAWNGIDIQGADGNTIVGNYVGTDPSGTLAKGNFVAGIAVSQSENNVIGGTAPGDGNLVSGNTSSGIQFDSPGNTAIGNLIGTTADGTVALGNSYGIYINNVGSSTIGGTSAGERNVISGNATYGVLISGTGAANNTIAGNYIGTVEDGTAALPNNCGLAFAGGASNNTVGGTVAGSRNVISGNTDVGISFSGTTVSGNVVQGNCVGTNAAGTAAVPNSWGIRAISGASGITIGGSAPAARNVLSGNSNSAIILNGPNVANHTIIGNYIGTDAAGTSGLPNNNGVYIMGGAHDNSVGGPLASDSNLIAFNDYSGVIVQGASLDNGILGNKLHSNTSAGQVGIDLGGDAVTANNGTKSASLPNSDMDFPILTSVTLAGNTLNLQGYVGSSPGQSLFAGARVEVFESDLDASGYGEGISFLGFLTADANGNFSGALDVSGNGVTVGDEITATATDASGNTSEFAANVTATLPASYEIAGTIYEDIDFVGVATDWDLGANDIAQPNVDVELYSAADGYLASTTTAVDGSYVFTNLSNGTYKIRVRSATIGDSDTPPAGGYNADVPAIWPYPLAEMTWGHGTAMLGGQDPDADDTATGDDAGPGDTWVAVTVSGSDVAGVNLGFSYEVIVNTNDDLEADNLRSKQGCLRQFIKNSNAIAGVNKSWFQVP